MNELKLLYIKKCDKIIISKECPICSEVNDLDAIFCKNKQCKTNLFIYPIIFRWKIFLIIPKKIKSAINDPGNFTFKYKKHRLYCYKSRVFISGSTLNPVMGMTCNDFMTLANNHGFEVMSYLLSKFFFHSYFLINRGYERILKIKLPRGNQLNFLNWISMQTIYGFSHDVVLSEILNSYYNDSDEENAIKDTDEEKKNPLNTLFGPKFLLKNILFFGKSPFPIESNVNDIILSLESENNMEDNQVENPSENFVARDM